VTATKVAATRDTKGVATKNTKSTKSRKITKSTKKEDHKESFPGGEAATNTERNEEARKPGSVSPILFLVS
jgi:hypothetical protein